MRVYLLMFLYILIAGCIVKYTVAIRNYETEKSYRVSLVAAFVVVLLPLVLIGFRTEYNDTEAYIAGFNRIATDFSWLKSHIENSKGFTWVIYQWIIKKNISSDSKVFLMLTAILQMLAIIKLYKKYSVDYVYSILLFFLSCSFLYMMGAIRQFAALTVILFFSDLLFDGKLIRFVIIVLFASTIHISAIIWLPMIFVVRGKPGNIRMIITAVLVLFVLMYIDQFTGILAETLEGTLYEGYPAQFANDDGSNIMHSFIAAVPVLIWILGKHQVDQKNNKIINILINISIVGLMANLLAHFTSGLLVGRIPIFFTVYNFVLLPWLIEIVFEKRSAVFVKVVGVCCYFVYALYYMNSTNIGYISTILRINAN